MYREFELIDQIAEMFPAPEGVTVGIGDDCAVLDPGRFDLVTTDTIVEGVHFRRDWSSPQDTGWKALAVCLSDVAAMGGGPGAFFLNLMLGPGDDDDFVRGLLEGMRSACDELVPSSFEVSAGGGDTTATSGPTIISITLLGESAPAGPVLRSGAVPGDRVVMLGPAGLSAAAVDLFSGKFDVNPEDYPALLHAHRRPTPRVQEGALLGLYGIPSAMIDVSDGLGQDLGHILTKSQVGATLETHNLPRHHELMRFASDVGVDVLDYILGGGDDYELVATVPPARMPKLWDVARRHQWDVYDIGEVRAPSEGLRILGPDGQPLELTSLGYQHFEQP